MKLDMKADFTAMPRAERVAGAAEAGGAVAGAALLAHDERHLRRKVLTLDTGERVFVDLPEAVALRQGDRLALDDGRFAGIAAAEEEVHDIRARDAAHLAELAWHIGNRHLAAAISADRILILRDHVIKAMLEGLGATVTDRMEAFEPVRGAYAGQGHPHGHGHDHGHPHPDAERDGHGRLPGDPHFGHNHA